MILIRCFFHDIYFRNVVSIDFVSGILQPCFQHVEYSRRKGLIRGLPAVLLKSKAENKEPVTPEVIQRLVAHYGSVSASLADLRLLILCVLGYAGFFRFNELV